MPIVDLEHVLKIFSPPGAPVPGGIPQGVFR